ncbi:MAG: PKD domain-containing protein [Cyclobacteriaceae bacterium]|nr:PKD domain-containing protein [Cyclobacteriaceae bacterium]
MRKNNYLFIILSVWMFAACSENDFPVPQSSSIVPSFTFTSSNEGFAPDTITFTNMTEELETAGTVSYTWNFDDGQFSTDINPTHVFKAPGTYTVTMIAISADQMKAYKADVLVKDPTALVVSLYYIDAGSKFISDTDGNAFATKGLGYGVEYDADNGVVYYSDIEGGKVWKTNLSGGEHQEILSGLTSPRDLALDSQNQKLYVVDRGSNSVMELNLADLSSKVLYNTAGGLGEKPEAIDYHNGFLYITCVEIDFESVWKAKVDGSAIENIIDYGAGGYGYGLAVDKINNKLYFDNTDNDEILMSNLDGSGIAVFANTGGRVYGLVVDNSNGKVYWSDEGDRALKMANLDGSGLTDVAVELTSPAGVFFVE